MIHIFILTVTIYKSKYSLKKAFFGQLNKCINIYTQVTVNWKEYFVTAKNND